MKSIPGDSPGTTQAGLGGFVYGPGGAAVGAGVGGLGGKVEPKQAFFDSRRSTKLFPVVALYVVLNVEGHFTAPSSPKGSH